MKALSLLAVSAAMLFANGAYAADLMMPAKAPAAAPAVSDPWDGFYIGANVGGGMGNRTGCWNPTGGGAFTCPLATASHDFNYSQQGGLIGAQAGFNYTLSNNFVVGIEASADAANITGNLNGTTAANGGQGTYTWVANALGKLGYATDKYMLYVDGGYGAAGFTFAGNGTGNPCDFSQTLGGGVLGVGAAVQVADNLSLDANYNHSFYGASSSTCRTGGTITVQNTSSSNDIVKLGLDYHFGQ